jgi:hypothetical protein
VKATVTKSKNLGYLLFLKLEISTAAHLDKVILEFGFTEIGGENKC